MLTYTQTKQLADDISNIKSRRKYDLCSANDLMVRMNIETGESWFFDTHDLKWRKVQEAANYDGAF